jgi:tetratricopeptide (TPR) repeat protein
MPRAESKCRAPRPLASPPLPVCFAFGIWHLAFGILLAHAGEWKVPREYRRQLTGGGDAETVVVTFYDGGHPTPNGFLVADEQDNVLPSKVLWAKRGGDTWLAYSPSKAKGSVFVYYGPGAGAPSSGGTWQPKLSLLLYTLPMPRGALENYRSIETAVHVGQQIYGLGFADKIWHGVNPFGPDENFASYYVGWLNIEKPGKYKIFTASCDASFVLLEGKPLCSWPGRHDPHGGTTGQHGGEIHLDKGRCKIEYYHAKQEGQTCMMLGWTPPGEQGYKVIPDSAFLHSPVARAGTVERRGGAPSAYFVWDRDDQLLLEKYQYTRVSFRGECRNVPPKAKLLWDFGDESRGEGSEKQHIYVGDGPFTATLRIVGEDNKALDQYAVAIPIVAQLKNFTILDEQAVRQYAQTIASTDCSKIPGATMDALWEIIETQEDAETIQPFVETYVQRFTARGGVWHAADRLALACSIKEPERALKLYGGLVANAPTPLDAARVQMERIELVLHKLKKPEQALEMAKAIRYTRSGLEARVALVKVGDISRAQGNFEEAEKAYREAQQVTYAGMDHRTIAVRQGGYLETAASHVEKGQLRAARDALVMWEIEHPIGKLSGDLILMTAKYFDKLGEPDRALAELETLTKLNPLTPYLPEVELLMGRAYKKLGKVAKARELFDKVMREYPKSRAAQQARME